MGVRVMKLSARNVLSVTVSSVKKGAVNTEVVIALKSGPSLAAVITNTSADNLALKDGAAAFAIIKATSIIVGAE
jgi:molybdate transport system regulatory protein